MLALVATAALAASPGGFRIGPGPSHEMVGVRQVVVPPVGGAWTLQSVPRARVAHQHWTLDVELPVVVTGMPGWRDAGLGLPRIGNWYTFSGSRVEHGIGLEVALPLVPKSLQVNAWGSLARETLHGVEVSVAYEVTTGSEAPRTFRALTGYRQGRYDGLEPWSSDGHPAFEVALAQVIPVHGPLAGVVEGELVWDRTILSLRALARLDVDDVSLDVGVQGAMTGDLPWGAAIAQLRGSLP